MDAQQPVWQSPACNPKAPHNSHIFVPSSAQVCCSNKSPAGTDLPPAHPQKLEALPQRQRGSRNICHLGTHASRATTQPNPPNKKKKYRQMEHRDRNQVPPGTAKPGSLELALLIALKSLAGTLPAPGRGAHTSAERVCTQPRCWTLPSMFDKLCHTTKIPSHYFQWK